MYLFTFLDDDVVIPVVQKKTLPSPSISSTEDSDTKSLITNDVEPMPEPEPSPPAGSNLNNHTTPSSESSQQEEQLNDKPSGHSRVLSDQSELINRAVPTRPESASLRLPQQRALFYTPNSKPLEQRHNQSKSPSDINSTANGAPTGTASPPSTTPEIVVERRVPNHLPLEPTNNLQPPKPDVSASPSGSKSPVRRTSSNDPSILRRVNSVKSERTPDLLSP